MFRKGLFCLAVILSSKQVNSSLDDEFWDNLGGKPEMIEPNEEEGVNSNAISAMYKISDESGHVTMTKFAQGNHKYHESLLDSDDCFVIDCGLSIYVWVGKAATKDEKHGAMRFAQSTTNTPITITKVFEGSEPEAFLSLFSYSSGHGWDDDLDEWPEPDDDEEDDNQAKIEGLCKLIKEVLDKKVERVVVSNRLEKSPCCLVTSEYGWGADMGSIMGAHALSDNSMAAYMKLHGRALAINPHNEIIQTLIARIENGGADKLVRRAIRVLFETSLVQYGFSLEDPTFAGRIHKVVELGLSIEADDDDDDDAEDILPELDDEETEDHTMEEVN